MSDTFKLQSASSSNLTAGDESKDSPDSPKTPDPGITGTLDSLIMEMSDVKTTDVKKMDDALFKSHFDTNTFLANQSCIDGNRLSGMTRSIDRSKAIMDSKLEKLSPSALAKYIDILARERQLTIDNITEIHADIPVYMNTIINGFSDMYSSRDNPHANKEEFEEIRLELIARDKKRREEAKKIKEEEAKKIKGGFQL